MKCFVTKNKTGVSLTFSAISEDSKIISTPQTVQVNEGENLANTMYSVLLEASQKPQPIDILF